MAVYNPPNQAQYSPVTNYYQGIKNPAVLIIQIAWNRTASIHNEKLKTKVDHIVNKYFIVPALVFWITAGIPCGAAAQSRYLGEAYFEGTMDQYIQGNFEAAARGFKRFLEFVPNDFNGHYRL